MGKKLMGKLHAVQNNWSTIKNFMQSKITGPPLKPYKILAVQSCSLSTKNS